MHQGANKAERKERPDKKRPKDKLFPNLQNDRFMSPGWLIAFILKVGKCQDLAGDITANFPFSFQWLRAMTQHISALHR